MDTSDYVKEAERQLEDQNIYREVIPEDFKDYPDLTAKHSTEIKNTLEDMLTYQESDLKTFEYLNVKEPRIAKFYFFPKIQKKEVKGRPI